MSTIFISHFSKDKELASRISRFLEDSLLMDHSQIYCSSMPDRANPGSKIDELVRLKIKDAQLIIIIVTRASLKSNWIVREFGAAWELQKWIIPIVVNIKIRRLPDWIKEYVTINAFKQQQLLRMVDEIGIKIGHTVQPSARILPLAEALIKFIREKYGPQKNLVRCLVACCVPLALGFYSWEYWYKEELVIVAGPFYVLNKKKLINDLKKQYHLPFFSKYKISYHIADGYKDLLLDLVRGKCKIAMVSPYTWLQFENNTLPLLDDHGKKVTLENFYVIGQKRNKFGDGNIRDYYQSCCILQKGDDILNLPQVRKSNPAEKWSAIPSDAFNGYVFFHNQITLSTSSFLVPFLSLLEKGISPDSLYAAMEPTTRIAAPVKVNAYPKSIAAQSDGEMEQEDLRNLLINQVIDTIRIPVKIPLDLLVVTMQQFTIWKDKGVSDQIVQILKNANMLSENSWRDAYAKFSSRVGSAIITAVRQRGCTGKGDNGEMEMDIWVPGTLDSLLLSKGFDYINTDILHLRACLKTHSPKLDIIGFDNGPARSATFNSSIKTVCTITPDTILHCNETSDIMTIRMHLRQLPPVMRESIKSLIGGYHIRRSGVK